MISISEAASHLTSILLIKGDQFAESKLLNETFISVLNKKKVKDLKIISTIDEHGNESIIIPFISKSDSISSEDLETLRGLGSKAFHGSIESQAKEVIILSDLDQEQNYAFVEGFALSNYSFDKYKKKKSNLLEHVYLGKNVLEAQQISTLNHTIKSVFYARDIVNEPLSGLNAQQISESAKVFAQEVGISYKELGVKEMQRLGMGGVLGVNQGSQSDPTFTVLEWKPKGFINKKPIVLVGKGVVYDTGGYSIKTGGGMVNMKCDMGGAAAVFGGIYLVALEQLPLHIITLVPAVENMINEKSIVPGDVINMSDGSTVEVLNTDAEGRLILADALVYARQFDPEFVFNFATLTGAAMRTFGYGATAFMGTASEEMKGIAKKAAFKSHERIAELPLWDDYAEQLQSKLADISNLGGPMAGAITAGKFLQHFVEYPWLHFDIAGPAFLEKASSYRPAGGTGTGVRFLLDFLKAYIDYVKN